jgi:hypothetical protein
MAREIPLSQGKVAIVSDCDFEHLSKFKWHAKHVSTTGEFIANRCAGFERDPCYKFGRKKLTVTMQQEILGRQPGLQIDHINRDSLDNRRENLRWATLKENARNRRHRLNATGYRGVSRHHGRFRACIFPGPSRRIIIGRFVTAQEAAIAWNQAAVKHYGDFAVLNHV